MAVFVPYEGLTTMMRKEYEVINNTRLGRNEIPGMMQSMLDLTLTHLPQIEGSLNQESITLLFEMSHYLLSHKVYYVETAMAQSLMKTNLQLQLSDLKLPYRIFEVSFKDDLQTSEGPIPSFLMAIMPEQAEIDSCNTFLGKTTLWKLHGTMSSLVYVRYQAPEGGICHANIPASFFADRTIDEAVDIIGENRKDTFQFTIAFSEQDKKIQKNLLRIAMGLLCYINTEAPDIKSWKNQNRPAIGTLKPDGWRVGASLPEAWFLRKGHFMVLRHERYTRQDGKARVVWRRPHEVLHKGKPLMPEIRGEVVDDSP
jgi:hypothetical protein